MDLCGLVPGHDSESGFLVTSRVDYSSIIFGGFWVLSFGAHPVYVIVVVLRVCYFSCGMVFLALNVLISGASKGRGKHPFFYIDIVIQILFSPARREYKDAFGSDAPDFG
jgi:hypothetical protein